MSLSIALMPIPTPLRKYYRGKEWESIQKGVIRRAKGRCEFCRVKVPTLFAKRLTIAHLDHNPRNRDQRNLAALCNGCHNEHDGKQKAATRRRTKARKVGQSWLSSDLENANRPEWYAEMVRNPEVNNADAHGAPASQHQL